MWLSKQSNEIFSPLFLQKNKDVNVSKYERNFFSWYCVWNRHGDIMRSTFGIPGPYLF